MSGDGLISRAEANEFFGFKYEPFKASRLLEYYQRNGWIHKSQRIPGDKRAFYKRNELIKDMERVKDWYKKGKRLKDLSAVK